MPNYIQKGITFTVPKIHFKSIKVNFKINV